MPTPDKIGRYEILEELGRGAMGVVYRALDPAMGRTVAVKTIISAALEGPRGRELRERFIREARSAGALSHPGIVSMFDVGEQEGTPFLVMEYVSGPTLAEFARGRERLSTDRICELGAILAEALGHAHSHGVVHRDIKPANILMTPGKQPGDERPKITDFGVAKLAEQSTTMTGQMVGTPAFMPPEQFTGAPIDGRSDLFSLGVLLYWLTTGEQPFPGESVTSISYKVVNSEPVPPRRINPGVPARLDAIIMKCLAKSPAERYQSGEDLARELTEVRQPAAVRSAAVPAFDPDATLLEAAPPRPAAISAAAQPGIPAAARSGRSRGGVWVALGAVMILAVGGWLGMRSSGPGAAEEPAVAESRSEAARASSPAAPDARQPSATRQAAPPRARPADSAAADSPPPAPAAAASPAPPAASRDTAEAPAAPPARVEFDPRALDRRSNARLELDVTRMPAGLEFALLMDERIYFEKTGAAAYKKDGDLYVPPGVHEFRAVAREGAVEKGSNTVSLDFRPNKRSTLKMELRLQGKPAEAGMPNGLYEGSQLVLTWR